MLTLTSRQIDNFEDGALSAYQRELLPHCRDYAPELWQVAGEPAFVAFVDRATQQAMGLGLNLRGPMRLYVDLSLSLGLDFHADPQYAPLWPDEDPAALPMPFAQHLLDRYRQYEQACLGERAQLQLAALRALSVISFDPDGDFRSWARDSLHAAYPQKLQYMGDSAFQALLDTCAGVARELNLQSPRGRFLVLVLALCFGARVTENPLYPWLARRLREPGPEAQRVDNTLAALRIYVDRVIDTLQEG